MPLLLVLPVALHRLLEPGFNIVYPPVLATLASGVTYPLPWWVIALLATLPGALVSASLVRAVVRQVSGGRWARVALGAAALHTALFFGTSAWWYGVASNDPFILEPLPAVAPQIAAHAPPAAEAFFAAAVAARQRKLVAMAAAGLVLAAVGAELGQIWRSQVFWGQDYAYDHVHTQVLLHLAPLPGLLVGGGLAVRNDPA